MPVFVKKGLVKLSLLVETSILSLLHNNVFIVSIMFVVTCNGSLAVAQKCFGERTSVKLRDGSLPQV